MYGGEHNMVKLDEYRQLIKEIFTTYNSHKPACGEVEVELIFDMERDCYWLVHAGWNKHAGWKISQI